MVSTAPWKAARSGFGQSRSIVGRADGKPVTIAGSVYDDEAQALIAAAPELVEALSTLLRHVSDERMSEADIARHHNAIFAKAVMRARAAIAKATGQ